MSYKKINWTNTPLTPVSAENLNIMDNGINELYNLHTKSEKTNIGLWNFSSDTLMLNSKNFLNSDNYRTVDSPTISIYNSCLEVSTSIAGARAGIYGELRKAVSLLATGANQLLVKLRIKASRPTRIYPVKRNDYINGTYITTDNIVVSNLDNVTTTSSYWQIDDTDWHDLLLIFRVKTNEKLNEIGIMFEGYQDTATCVSIQQFDAFLNTDVSDSTSLITELEEVNQRVENIEIIGENCMNNKLDINQGTANTGLVMAVGTDGNLKPQAVGEPSDEQVENAVSNYLAEHTELTTTVEDGSVTIEKLSNDLKDTVISGKANISARKTDKKLGASVFWNSRNTTEANAKAEIQAMADAGFDKVVICIHEKYNHYVADDWGYSNSVDLVEYAVNYANSIGLTASVKIAPIDAKNQLANQGTITEGWQEKHKEYLDDLVSRNLAVDWVTDFNESQYILSNENYKEFVLLCLEALKTTYKTGISFNWDSLKPCLSEITEACDFIAFNTYPRVGFTTVENAKKLTSFKMAEIMEYSGARERIEYAHSVFGKEIVVTEIGCGSYWEMYQAPEVSVDINTSTFSDYETNARYMDAAFEYLNTSVATEITSWYTEACRLENGKIQSVLRKWRGESV